MNASINLVYIILLANPQNLFSFFFQLFDFSFNQPCFLKPTEKT